MSFLDILRIMVFIIIIALVIFVGRIIVFEHLEVFLKGLPPTQLWHPVMRIFFSAINSSFHYIIAFIVIMYVLYIIIKLFVPNIEPILPLKNILLSITPIYELRISGIFRLLDSVVGIIFSSLPFVDRIIRVGRAFGLFLAFPFFFLQSFATKKIINTRAKTSIELKFEKEKDAFVDDTEGEPLYEKSIDAAGNRYIEKEYKQCISEKYVIPDSNMTEDEKNFIVTKNNIMQKICQLLRIQSYGKLITEKYL